MQTFLPFADFARSAQVLDNRRLGKQRVEGWQILKALTNSNYGWQNHPAVKMWRGHEAKLAQYIEAVCYEWTMKRGFRDSISQRIWDMYADGLFDLLDPEPPTPWWLGYEPFHLSHQSNLARKLPLHYREYFPLVDDTLEYFWPDSQPQHKLVVKAYRPSTNHTISLVA